MNFLKMKGLIDTGVKNWFSFQNYLVEDFVQRKVSNNMGFSIDILIKNQDYSNNYIFNRFG
jgi:hypothetical protein